MSRRRVLPLALAGLLACLTSTVLVTGAGGSAGSAAASPRGYSPVCGSSRTLRTASRTWTCTFDDEFSGSSPDPTKWIAQTTATSGWTTGDTCYVNSPSTISQSNGALHLTAYTASTPTQCGSAYSTSHLGGAVTSRDRFAQTYGRFEIRAKFPATAEAGFWGDLWLYPQNLTYGAWPASGEIDIAEHWSSHPDYVLSALHYTGSGSADSRACTVTDASQFHTYRVEWSSTSMSFYYDDALCFTRSWTATTGSTAPFDKPFFVMLSEGFGDPTQTMSAMLPGNGPVDVDYVRVYR